MLDINVLSMSSRKKIIQNWNKIRENKMKNPTDNTTIKNCIQKLKYIADAYNSVIQITIAPPYIYTMLKYLFIANCDVFYKNLFQL